MAKSSLFDWIWKPLFKTALIPLLLMGVMMVAVFFTANEWTRQQEIQAEQKHFQQIILQLVSNEGELIEKQLLAISQTTDAYRKQTENALQNQAPLDPVQRDRLKLSPKGVYYSNADTAEDGAGGNPLQRRTSDHGRTGGEGAPAVIPGKFNEGYSQRQSVN